MSASGGMHSARTLAPGTGRGEVVRLEESLSLWGGLDPHTGRAGCEGLGSSFALNGAFPVTQR